MSDDAEVNLRRLILQSLESWNASGITHLTGSSTRATASPTSASPAKSNIATPAATSRDPASGPVVQPSVKNRPLEMPKRNPPKPATVIPVPPAVPVSEVRLESVNSAPDKTRLSRTERVAQLEVLCGQVAACVRCKELAETRTQTVFGVGNPEARVMFLGEAPGADEDRTGEPFVGKAGQLLNKIIEAMKLKREEIYICNILRCRPPDNRLPSLTEAANCREYLDGQIRIVGPEFIVCWGSCAAQNLLGITSAIGKMRGRFYPHGDAKVLCTYHPSYLLRNPAAKKDVWEDMQILMKELGISIA